MPPRAVFLFTNMYTKPMKNLKQIFLAILILIIANGCSLFVNKSDVPGKPITPDNLPTNFRILDLSNQGLTSIKAEQFNDANITELNVSNNNLTGSLPAEVRRLPALQTINASYNNFTGIPAEIGQLKNLVSLDYSYNNLDTMPDELQNLVQLEYLSLAYNNYQEVPFELNSLKNLKVLDLRANPIPADQIDKLRQALPLTDIKF